MWASVKPFWDGQGRLDRRGLDLWHVVAFIRQAGRISPSPAYMKASARATALMFSSSAVTAVNQCCVGTVKRGHKQELLKGGLQNTFSSTIGWQFSISRSGSCWWMRVRESSSEILSQEFSSVWSRSFLHQSLAGKFQFPQKVLIYVGVQRDQLKPAQLRTPMVFLGEVGRHCTATKEIHPHADAKGSQAKTTGAAGGQAPSVAPSSRLCKAAERAHLQNLDVS